MTSLYLLTPPKITPDFPTLLERTLKAGNVEALQIRLKDHAPNEIEALACPLVEIAHAQGTSVIINDDPKLARRLGADGVHIGQDDPSFKEARSTVGPRAIIGVTCHDSRHLAMTAAEAGADYVAFGAFYPTATKTPKTSASADLLEWWSEIFKIPCVAIGGITLDNVTPLIEAGADYIAVSSGVWDYSEGPEKAVEQFSQALA